MGKNTICPSPSTDCLTSEETMPITPLELLLFVLNSLVELRKSEFEHPQSKEASDGIFSLVALYLVKLNRSYGTRALSLQYPLAQN